MPRVKNFIPIITKEEFERLQPRCSCGCNRRISWRKVYRSYGIPKYIIGHAQKNKELTEEHKNKISKSKVGIKNPRYISFEEKGIDITKIYYCKCNCGQAIEIKKWHKTEGIPNYIKGHKKKYYPSINKEKVFCQCGCGQEITWRWWHNIKGTPKYKAGHVYKSRTIPTKLKNILSSLCGSNSPHWKGGISFEPYCPKFNKQLKERIRNKYDRKCFNCDKDEKDNKYINGKQAKLSVHHIDYDKQQGCNGKRWELIPLCSRCHARTINDKKRDWQQHFRELLKLYEIKNVWNWFN